jgi:hypothetical protein
MAFTKYLELNKGTVFPGSNLTDFAMLYVIIADSDIAAELASGGGIKVTNYDGSQDLPFGLYPSSDPASGTLILRVLASPTSSGSQGDPHHRLYVDSGETTIEDKAGVVSNDFHYFLVPGDYGSGDIIEDWVSGTKYDGDGVSASDLVAGVVDRAIDFDAGERVILDAEWIGGLAELTVELTFKSNGNANGAILFDASLPISIQTNSSDRLDFNLRDGVNSGLQPAIEVVTPTISDDGSTWISIAAKNSGTTDSQAVFYDGTQVASATKTFATFDEDADNIPAQIAGGTTNGAIGEVRVSTVYRDDDWLAWAYENDFNNAATWQKGDFVGGAPPAGGNLVTKMLMMAG